MLIYFNSPPLIGQHTRDIMEDLGFGENTIQQVAKHTETSLMNFIGEKRAEEWIERHGYGK